MLTYDITEYWNFETILIMHLTLFDLSPTFIILLWLTPDHFTRKAGTSRTEKRSIILQYLKTNNEAERCCNVPNLPASTHQDDIAKYL